MHPSQSSALSSTVLGTVSSQLDCPQMTLAPGNPRAQTPRGSSGLRCDPVRSSPSMTVLDAPSGMRWMPWLSIVSCAVLVPMVLGPGLVWSLALFALSGMASGYQLLAMCRIGDIARNRADRGEFRQSPSGAGKRLRVPRVDGEGPAATS